MNERNCIHIIFTSPFEHFFSLLLLLVHYSWRFSFSAVVRCLKTFNLDIVQDQHKTVKQMPFHRFSRRRSSKHQFEARDERKLKNFFLFFFCPFSISSRNNLFSFTWLDFASPLCYEYHCTETNVADYDRWEKKSWRLLWSQIALSVSIG